MINDLWITMHDSKTKKNLYQREAVQAFLGISKHERHFNSTISTTALADCRLPHRFMV